MLSELPLLTYARLLLGLSMDDSMDDVGHDSKLTASMLELLGITCTSAPSSCSGTEMSSFDLSLICSKVVLMMYHIKVLEYNFATTTNVSGASIIPVSTFFDAEYIGTGKQRMGVNV